MIWVRMGQNPNLDINKQKTELYTREYYCGVKEDNLKKREVAIQQKYEEALKLREQVDGLRDFIEKQQAEVSAALKAKEQDIIRQAEARGRQRAIDEINDPDYTRCLALRDFKTQQRKAT
jgi:hypothetical protein